MLHKHSLCYLTPKEMENQENNKYEKIYDMIERKIKRNKKCWKGVNIKNMFVYHYMKREIKRNNRCW